MTIRRAKLLPIAVTALLLGCVEASAATSAVLARPSGSWLPTAALVPVQTGDVGAAAAAAAARNATGGQVLGVSERRDGGRVIYRVKVLLPGGRMRTVIVDGASGRVAG